MRSQLASKVVAAVWTVWLASASAGESPETGLEPKFTPEQRLAPERLRAVREAREQLAAKRVPLPEWWGLDDYRAVIHVHAEDSNHTRGTREQVLTAARRA